MKAFLFISFVFVFIVTYRVVQVAQTDEGQAQVLTNQIPSTQVEWSFYGSIARVLGTRSVDFAACLMREKIK